MKKPKIAVFSGASGGWLGTKLATRLDANMIRADIADAHRVGMILDAYKPDVIVNCVGRAGPPTAQRGRADIPQNIDWCNLNDATRWETVRSNVLGVRILAAACSARGIKIYHLSSGCIFDGPSPGPDGWRETDEPAPVSFYGRTKVDGERELPPDACIIRLRLPVDREPHPRNLIDKLIRYEKVIDVENSVTVIPSLLDAVAVLIKADASGIFHVTNPRPVRHTEILEWYRRYVDASHRYELVPAGAISTLASEGRSNCVLDTSKLERYISLPPADQAIRACLVAYRQSLQA
ncbi:MAG TPA: sugar nucleotide-binding protein [Candidatus Paceibacterota bacterium]|nr:sugar nucleotide-binding protein [Candidatus Paceibacterota bacterium]